MERGSTAKGHSGTLPNIVREPLKELGLWGTVSNQKFIPQIYKKASLTSRLALLQGLIDGDGRVENHGSVRFSTTSEQLATDVVDLARSVGAWATKKTKNIVLFIQRNTQERS